MSSQPGIPKPLRSSTRLAAALRVKVTARIRSGSRPSSNSRATLLFIANDLPVPGPAKTLSGEFSVLAISKAIPVSPSSQLINSDPWSRFALSVYPLEGPTCSTLSDRVAIDKFGIGATRFTVALVWFPIQKFRTTWPTFILGFTNRKGKGDGLQKSIPSDYLWRRIRCWPVAAVARLPVYWSSLQVLMVRRATGSRQSWVAGVRPEPSPPWMPLWT